MKLFVATAALAAIALCSPGIIATASADLVGVSGCITNNPFDGNPVADGARFESIPLGCDATNNGVPIVFDSVRGLDGLDHAVTLTEFTYLSSALFDDHDAVFIVGTNDGAGFNALATAFGTKPVGPPLASQGFGVPITFTLTSGLIDVAPNVQLRFDPTTLNTFTQTVTALGQGLYQSLLTAEFTLDMTLDGGIHWTPNDPTLTLEPFVPSEHPGLAPLLASVPEPGSFALLGLGIAALYRSRHRPRLMMLRRGLPT
jgi:hypothetical protein